MERHLEINLSPFFILGVVIGIVIMFNCLIKEDTKQQIAKEQTKQLELQLQIEQEKNK